jgi:1-pyrroline-5-carboxylate dehydrogenase
MGRHRLDARLRHAVEGVMATRLTYTSGTRTPELDAAFERCLEAARAGAHDPLPHVVGDTERTDGAVFAREDPSRAGEVASRAREAPDEIVHEAVAAAAGAQPDWRAMSVAERCALMRAAADQIRGRVMEMAAVVTLETGKPRVESIAEVEEAVDLIETYCAQIEQHDGFEVPLGTLSPNERNRSVLRPFGVFGVIGPFNFPVALVTGMSAGALVAGNTVVVKPSEHAPWSGALVGEAFACAGLPAGVINVVHGGPQTGAALAGSDIDGVVFTGSAEVGRELARSFQEGAYGRPAIVEMGGKNPAIVTAAADLDAAAEGIVASAFGFSGQKCSACSRAIVVDAVHDELVERLRDRTEQLGVGDPADADVYTGPVIDERAVERFEAAVRDAERDGAIVTGGGRPDVSGLYVEPTIVSDLPAGHPLTREELFVPFVTVTRVGSLDEALAEANAVDYGLTAGIFSLDDDEVARFLDEIEAGVVYVNRRAGATTGAWPGIQSFCGWKSSGSTGKGGLGPYYVQQFMREQSRTVVET